MKAYNSAIENNPDKKYGSVWRQKPQRYGWTLTHAGILQKANVGGK
jgi:hypothetical protein